MGILTDDLYKTPFGRMEQIFRKHNYWVMIYGDYERIKAIPFHEAMELVEKNIWEDVKRKYLVMLPKQSFSKPKA